MTQTPLSITLIIEGTYPYVRGGVSQWVDSIIRNTSHCKFNIVWLGDLPKSSRKQFYTLPKNVISLNTFYLFQQTTNHHRKNKSLKWDNILRSIYENMQLNENDFIQQLPYHLKSLIEAISLDDYNTLFNNHTLWHLILDYYKKNYSCFSFTDYFWHVRSLLLPIFNVLKAIQTIPSADIIHSVSSGYAGLTAVLLKLKTGARFYLTEHGIYSFERKIELLSSSLFSKNYPLIKHENQHYHFLYNFTKLFSCIDKICYNSADTIVSLTNKHRHIQISHGATKDKTIVIANGVNVEHLSALQNIIKEENHIVLIGRVVPIKDIKTFINAIALLYQWQIPFKASIFGSSEEDPQYAKECMWLIHKLGLNSILSIQPHQNIEEILAMAKLTILSSISEGQPLVILESFAAGIPVIATDVGSCKELIYGDNNSHAGAVVPVSNPNALAEKIKLYLFDHNLYNQAKLNAIKRVTSYYDAKIMYKKYHDLYGNAVIWQA